MENNCRYYILTLILVSQSCLCKKEDLPEKCLLTKLEEDIKEYRATGSRLFLPTLKKLKKLYPGDKFRTVKENKCVDLESEELCRQAAEYGNCNGTNHKVKQI